MLSRCVGDLVCDLAQTVLVQSGLEADVSCLRWKAGLLI